MLTWPNEVWECCDPLRLVVTLPATSPCAQRVMSCIKLSSVTDLSSPVRPNNSSELIRHEHNPGFLSFAGRENCLEDQVWVTLNTSEHSRVIKWRRNPTKQTMENLTKSNMSVLCSGLECYYQLLGQVGLFYCVSTVWCQIGDLAWLRSHMGGADKIVSVFSHNFTGFQFRLLRGQRFGKW